jgi:hypothetical protein
VRYVTNSEIVDYLTCRRSWAIKHVFHKGQVAEHISESRATGTFVHAGLEQYYLSDRQDDIVAAIHYEHAKAIERAVDPTTGLISEDDKNAADRALEFALIIVEGYQEWLAEEGADSDLVLVSAEEAVEHEILPGVKLLGKMDTVFLRERDGAKILFDHKVVQNFPDMHKTAHLSPQFKTYLALHKALGEEAWVDALVVNMLRKVKRTASAKPPFYERLEVRHNNATLRNHWLQMQSTIERMVVDEMRILDNPKLLEHAIQPTPSRDCSWRCLFYEGCSLVDDGSDWEGYIEVAFTDVNPLERYGQEVPA